MEYDFTYYKMDMAADIQMLILSEGKSNILPADLVLPLRPSSVDCYGDVDPELLKAWRWYLATMRSLPHSIEQEMQKVRVKLILIFVFKSSKKVTWISKIFLDLVFSFLFSHICV